MPMNEFERKAFRYQALGEIVKEIENRERYYMNIKVDENGNYVRDENGVYVYEDPTDDYEKERLSVYREIRDDFKKWALK